MRRYETTYAVPGFRLHLILTITADGAASVDGTLRLEKDGASRFLIARGTGHASCADVDGDGIGGLTRLEADFQNAATQASYRLVLRPTGADIDATGAHEIILELAGSPTVTGQAFIRVTTEHSARRRRRRRSARSGTPPNANRRGRHRVRRG